MKKIVLCVAPFLCAGVAYFTLSMNSDSDTGLDLLMQNIEALASGESGGQVIKKCYTVFHPTLADEDFYASCSRMSIGSIRYECGAVSAFMPLWGITQQGECYQSV